MRLTAWMCLLLSTGALTACGPSVKDVCSDLEDDCPAESFDEDDCVGDGERLQESAEDRQCEDSFDDYIDCVADSGCGWRDRCLALRDALDACMIGG